jgi:UPF0042 nucleotide-binding protein
LEDLGYQAVDNPPLPLVEDMVISTTQPIAIGVDCRTQGFNAEEVLATLARLRLNPALRPQLIYAWADHEVLLSRYTETRRRHPLALQGLVSDGIQTEEALTAPLRAEADLIIDTSGMALPDLRQLIERRFGANMAREGNAGMTMSLMSFAFPAGLPRQADMVFDARFLRNPHYDPHLRPRTGQDPEVGAYVAADPDFTEFYAGLRKLLDLVLPRFVQEGKKYASVAIGCTGGRHRSVYLIESLARDLTDAGWRLHVTHRELARGDAAYQLAITTPSSTNATQPQSVPAKAGEN